MILVAGEALVDVFPDGTARPGGSPYNVAVGLARLGAPVALAARIADDREGRILRDSLQREGVDPTFLGSSRVTPTAKVILDAGGAPSYVFAGLADLEVDVAEPIGPDISCLHLGSYALVAPRSAPALLERFDSSPPGLLRSIDPNVRLSMEPSAERWRAAVAAFAERTDILKLSEEDIRSLFGREADVDSIAAAWLSDRCALVALTRGEHGATFFTRRQGRIDGAARPVDVVDTVGAGDAFQSALLAGLTEGGRRFPRALDELGAGRLRALLDTAIEASALTCARRGADPPTRWQLNRGQD